MSFAALGIVSSARLKSRRAGLLTSRSAIRRRSGSGVTPIASSRSVTWVDTEINFVDDLPTWNSPWSTPGGDYEVIGSVGLAAGECLFLGASGSKRGEDDWEIAFRFAASP